MKQRISALLSAVLLLSLLAGCAQQKDAADMADSFDVQPTIFYDVTGIAQDEIVMTVGQTEVPAELYFYWLSYVCSTIEYNIMSDYSNYGLYSTCVDTETRTVDWSASYASMPLMDYARAEAEQTIKYYMAIEELAEEKGAGLTTANEVDLENNFQSAVEEMGGNDEFVNYLLMLGISRETFDRISAASYLYMNLLDQVFDPSSDLYLTEEAYNDYAVYADHILVATQNMESGENLSPDEVREKYNLASDLLEQLQAADDLETLFAELADTYSEDPGREAYPTGYIYAEGDMVQEFESAALLLEPGEISGIVQSDYGFHIILRRDLLAALREDESKKVDVAKEYLNQCLVKKRSASAVTYAEIMDGVDWDSYYRTYVTKVDEIAAANSADQAE